MDRRGFVNVPNFGSISISSDDDGNVTIYLLNIAPRTVRIVDADGDTQLKKEL